MTTKQNKTKNKLREGLEAGDMRGLVSDVIMIDMFKPKIGDEEDTVVVAFTVQHDKPAKDLSSFIETGATEHLDVDVSPAPDEDGSWKVFVEFQRDHDLFGKIADMITSIDQVTSHDGGWKYRAYGVDKEMPFTIENLERNIIDSRYEYRKKYIKNEPEEPMDDLEESWLRRIEEMLKNA